MNVATRRPSRAAVALGAALTLTVAGCGTSDGASSATECRGIPQAPAGPDTPSYLILIDLPDNSAASADRIVDAGRTWVGRAVASGARLRVVIDPGQGQTLRTVPCLDGAHALSVRRANDRRQQADTALAQQHVSDLVGEALRGAPVQRYGSAARLLRAASDLPAVESTVVLFSPLLGIADDASDCMNVDGLTADPSVASAVVTRCLNSHQFSRMARGELELIGVGSTAVTPQQSLLASWEAGEICRQVAQRCGTNEGS